METKRNKHLLASLLAAAALVTAMLPGALAADTSSADARVYYEKVIDSAHDTVAAGVYSYDCFSTLYYSASETKGSVWAVESGRRDVNATVTAYLYNAEGSVRKTNTRTDTSYIHFVETPHARISGTIITDGDYKLYHANGSQTYTGGVFPAVRYTPGRAAQAEDEFTVTGYEVNSKGETYGSYLGRHTLGYAPDLIAAVNDDEVFGYVRLDDFTYASEIRSQQAEDTIPMYDLDGKVIAQFDMSEQDAEEPLDPATLERIEALGGDSAAIAARYFTAAKVEERYPVNAKGESYGSYLDRLEYGYAPKLMSVVGDEGRRGYVYTQQVRTAYENTCLDVWDLEGNVIDTFSIIDESAEQ